LQHQATSHVEQAHPNAESGKEPEQLEDHFLEHRKHPANARRPLKGFEADKAKNQC